MRETIWSKLLELRAIRRRCKEIQREQQRSLQASPSFSSRPVRSKPFLPGRIFAFCFFAACILHLRDMWLHGWLPYHNAPLPLNLFWTALVVLDLMAAVLLLVRPDVGLILSMVLMCTDVAVNAWARFDLHLVRQEGGAALLFLQLCFLAIVSAVTAQTIGRRKVRAN